ncbi:MAG TPA: hypothetical protein VMS64_19230 [Candidatus Methylomirabilis sp.]|nr:hypothetical protein [Candidatus Methylomirabilis sp.]
MKLTLAATALLLLLAAPALSQVRNEDDEGRDTGSTRSRTSRLNIAFTS